MTEEEFRAVLIKHIKDNYGTRVNAAKAWGITVAFVSAVTTGRKSPPEWMLEKLGYQRETIVRYHEHRV